MLHGCGGGMICCCVEDGGTIPCKFGSGTVWDICILGGGTFVFGGMFCNDGGGGRTICGGMIGILGLFG